MKLLIADDQSQRYKRLVQALSELGVAREKVDLVPSASEARTRLEDCRYDILILDLLLPLWPEAEPDVQHSLDLLTEIHEGETLRKPRRILGITADMNIAGQATPQFEDVTWSIIQFSADNDDWLNRILNCVKYAMADAEPGVVTAESAVDLAVICALEDPELKAVLALPWHWGVARPIDDRTFVFDGKIVLPNRTISVCATFASRMGMVSTALLSSKIISLLRPKLLAMCGVCAGVREKTNFGDVLLADPAWDFQSGKRIKDKENTQFSIAPHQLQVPSLIRSHVEQLRGDAKALTEITAAYDGTAPSLMRLMIGPVASGSAVLADGQVIQEIKNQHRELIGVEMEAYGMYAAAYAASDPQPLAFALKAVCDFADPDKKDNQQRFAAYTSANVLRLLMERFGTRLLASGG